METKKSITGYKGFNKGMVCRDKQYAENKTFTEKGEIELCGNGMHFCELPADVLNYYPYDGNQEYAEVEAIGDVIQGGDKTVTNKLKVKGKVTFWGLMKAHFEVVKETIAEAIKDIDASQGDYAHSASQGDGAHSASQGD